MRVTIIRDDGVVGVDGVFRTVNLSTLPDGVRAVQWDGESGHVEHDSVANVQLSSLSSYQSFIDLWAAAAPVSPPSPVIPTKISIAQAEHALYQSGYLDAVEAIIATQGRPAQIDWQRRPTVERSHPLVQLVKNELQWTEQQLDDLFTLGASL